MSSSLALARASLFHHNDSMLLIFPPIAKPCEPPAGIAQLAAALNNRSISCQVLDANLAGVLWLLQQPYNASDTWSRRAAGSCSRHLTELRGSGLYRSPARYSRAVRDLNRLLAMAGHPDGATVGLTDYQHSTLSPLRSADLLSAAEHPRQNPFYPWFSKGFDHWLHGIATVGFSVNYLSQALCAFAMIGHIRKRFPEKRIILGGGLITSWMRQPGWKNPFGGMVDHLIQGAGEIPLLELLGCNTAERERAIPDYTLLPLHDYLAPGFILPFSTAGGCYWNRCSFCPERAEGNLYAPLPVAQAMNDLHALCDRTPPLLLHLLDSAISPAFLRALVIDPPGVPWYGFVRFGPELADPDFCHALRRSGCIMLKLGLESGDQGVLERLNKGINLGEASQALENLRRAGIKVYLYLLFGTPAESVAEARRTLAFVERHREAITFMNLALFNMPVNSDEAAGYGIERFHEGDLSLYTPFRHPHGWERKQVRSFLDKEFKRSPAVAAILRNDPPLFTSNHAPFFSDAPTL